jgi:hypothetical protein
MFNKKLEEGPEASASSITAEEIDALRQKKP